MVELTLTGNAHTSVRTLLKVTPSNGVLVGLSATADNAKMTAPTVTRKTAVRRLNMRLVRRKGARLTEFSRNRVVVSFVFILVEVGLFDLCERAFRSRLTLREEGQVELLGETPNGLSTTATLAKGDGECQYYFLQWRVPRPQTPSAFSTAASFCEAITKPNSP